MISLGQETVRSGGEDPVSRGIHVGSSQCQGFARRLLRRCLTAVVA